VTKRRAVAAALTAGALLFLCVRFGIAARETNQRSRNNACRALAADPVPALLQNREAPDFELADWSGKKVSLRGLRGRPVLLNFWATWCPPCVEEMPGMDDLARRLAGSDAVVLSVSVDENWDVVRRFFPQGTPMTVLLDSNKDVPKLYGTEKYPETFLIDAQGKVRHAFINKREWGRPEAVFCMESLH